MKRGLQIWVHEVAVVVRKAEKPIPVVGRHASQRARKLLKEGTDGGLKGVARTLVQKGFSWSVVSSSTLSLGGKKWAKEDGITLKGWQLVVLKQGHV